MFPWQQSGSYAGKKSSKVVARSLVDSKSGIKDCIQYFSEGNSVYYLKGIGSFFINLISIVLELLNGITHTRPNLSVSFEKVNWLSDTEWFTYYIVNILWH